MAEFDAPGATAPLNVDNLPNEMLTTIFRQVANQPDRVAAFYEINALRSTNRRFQAVVESDPTIRSDFRTLLRETQAARLRNARIEANSVGTRTADEITTYHDVTGSVTLNTIRWLAAERDINAGMVAPTAIERNGVTDPGVLNTIRLKAAQRDIDAGMVAPTAIERNGVTDPNFGNIIRRKAAQRDIDAGMVAPDAIARNGVTDPDVGNTIRRLAAERDINAGKVASTASDRDRYRERDRSQGRE